MGTFASSKENLPHPFTSTWIFSQLQSHILNRASKSYAAHASSSTTYF